MSLAIFCGEGGLGLGHDEVVECGLDLTGPIPVQQVYGAGVQMRRPQQLQAVFLRAAEGLLVREDDALLPRFEPKAGEEDRTTVRAAVADGHHRYETALGYRDEVRATAGTWTGEEPENFALAALTSAQDPGLLVLPIHRVTKAEAPLEDALARLRTMFHIETAPSRAAALAALRESGASSVIGLAAAGRDVVYLLSPGEGADRLLPQDRSVVWRQLDYSLANYAVLQHGLGLHESQMKDYSMVWFTEDADEAVEQVRNGRARYAVLLKPVTVTRVLDIADAGERMPQKSTFFYPKVPTGIVFNLVQD